MSVGDVADVERYCDRVLQRTLARWGARLSPEQREDAHSFLIVTALELHERYRPEVGTFRGYLSTFLPLRLASWYRQAIADTRYGEQPPLVVDDVGDRQDAGALDWQERLVEKEAAASMLAELSDEGRETLRLVVVPLTAGRTYAQVEHDTHVSRATLQRRVDAVRDELLANYWSRTR